MYRCFNHSHLFRDMKQANLIPAEQQVKHDMLYNKLPESLSSPSAL